MDTFLTLLTKGLIAGFCYSLTSVTAALFCAHFVVKRGWLCGFVAGIGVAIVQLIWSTLAIFLLDISMDHFPIDPLLVSIIGATILYILAWKAFQMSKEPVHSPPEVPHQKLKAFAQAIPLALAYPLRTVGFAAIFILLGVHKIAPFDAFQGSGAVIGVGLGSLTWWVIVTLSVLGLKDRFTPAFIKLSRRISAFGIAAFATGGLVTVLIHHFY
ncbi:MAG: LysE family transporter [Chlamydiales bacterium]|nr:LysE family transporter [Chlamydiales bacterium]